MIYGVRYVIFLVLGLTFFSLACSQRHTSETSRDPFVAITASPVRTATYTPIATSVATVTASATPNPTEVISMILLVRRIYNTRVS